MSLTAVVTYSLGSAVARALLKTLLKDDALLGELLPELLDRLRGRAADERALLAALRRVEAIGARVAAQLGPLFDEGRLAAPEREAVVRELALTLDAARIGADLLLDCRLEAGRLARQLERERPGATAALSEAETALYRRALALAAAALVLVATELEGFERMAWAQSLQSQEQILDYLQDMARRQAEPVAAFERDYRQAVVSAYDYLELFGIKTINAAIQRQQLSAAYVTLEAEPSRRSREARERPDTGKRGDERVLERLLGEERLAQLEERTVGPVEQVVAPLRRLVLRGEAGSGKTTLLRWLAVRAASRTFPELLRGWNECVPFVIQLRKWVEQGFPPLEEFLGDLRRQVGEPPQHWVREQLRGGRALLLIDGVDELPQQIRETMLESLKSLVAIYPLARYIVTSRPLAVSEKQWPAWVEWTEAADFAAVALREMDRPTTERLVDQWHAALAPSVEHPDERAALAELPGNLKRLLRQRPELRRLSSNPLLCAMICALHRENGQNLPGRRVELYRLCIEMLLSRRDEGRKVRRGAEYPDLSHDQKLRLIRELAYDMRLAGELSRERAGVAAFFDEQLEATSPPNAGRGQDACALFCEVANLLHEPVDGRVEFRHRTFHDYLAALAAVRKRRISLLLEHAADEQWFDLIVLASGQTEQEDTDKLLRGILRQDLQLKVKGLLVRNARELRYRLHALALACLEVAEASTPAVRDEALRQAEALFPPTNETEARMVAAGGDVVVPLLVAKPEYSAAQAASCVHALAAIGSQKALETIAGYAADQRFDVKEALVMAWDNFDRRTFARLVMGEWTRILSWQLSSLEGIELLTNLTSLQLFNDRTQINDLAPLIHLTKLTTLSLGETQITNLSPLASLTNLTSLNLSRTQVSDLTPLTSLTNLTYLYLTGTRVSDLAPLAHLINLTNLCLINVNISDPSPLAGLSNLTYLDLEGTNISDLSPLAHLMKLTKLDLSGTDVRDITPLAHIPGPLVVIVSNGHKLDLAQVRQMPNIKLEYDSVLSRVRAALRR